LLIGLKLKLKYIYIYIYSCVINECDCKLILYSIKKNIFILWNLIFLLLFIFQNKLNYLFIYFGIIYFYLFKITCLLIKKQDIRYSNIKIQTKIYIYIYIK